MLLAILANVQELQNVLKFLLYLDNINPKSSYPGTFQEDTIKIMSCIIIPLVLSANSVILKKYYVLMDSRVFQNLLHLIIQD